MKTFYLILFSFVLPLFTCAQANYKPGYVIKANGDTLNGYINSREWERTPNAIEFRLTQASRETQKFTPTDIKEFHIAPYFTYTSFTGNISNNRNVFPYVDHQRDTSTTLDTIFLKQLVKGQHVSLLAYTDNLKNRFFYQEQDSKPVELKYYVDYQDNDQLSYSKIYIGQILLLNTKYGDKKNEILIEHTDFAAPDLINCFQHINGEQVAKDKSMNTSRGFVGFGVNRYKTGFGGDIRYSRTIPSVNYSPELSAGIDFFSNPQVQRLIFRAELSFSYDKPLIKKDYSLTADKQIEDYYTFKQYNIKTTPQILYNIFNKETLQIYADVGATFNLSLYSDNKMLPNLSTTYVSPPYKLESFWLSFPFKAGVIVNRRFEASVSYVTSTPYTKYLDFYIGSEVWAFNFKYLFGSTKK